MATMASRGSLEPPRIVVLVLGLLMGGIACAMLLVGGLSALQQAAVLGSVPFTFVIVGVAWCWITALREEVVPARAPSSLDASSPPADDRADGTSGDGVRVAAPTAATDDRPDR
jgi:choline-glycine betaine transporter